jgi:hypothetical protein
VNQKAFNESCVETIAGSSVGNIARSSWPV